MSRTASEKAAESLGVELASSPMAWVRAVEKGFPVSRLERFAREAAPNDSTFKYRIVSKATLARRKESKRARLSKEESERLTRIAKVFALAEEVWGTPENAIRFMNAPHALLEGESPMDVALRSEVGAKLVDEILGRLAVGSAV